VFLSCEFFAYLHYEGSDEWPRTLNGTGGGSRPQRVSGVDFDLTKPEGWALTRPLVPSPAPAQPDFRLTLNLGLLGDTCSLTPSATQARKKTQERFSLSRWCLISCPSGPTYKEATDAPLSMGRWYVSPVHLFFLYLTFHMYLEAKPRFRKPTRSFNHDLSRYRSFDK